MKRISVILCSFVFAFGCAKSSGTYYFPSPSLSSIKSDDAVTLLFTNIISVENSTKKELKVYKCICSAFEDRGLNIRVIPPDEFRQIAFQNLSHDKTSNSNWENLVKDNAFNERIMSLNLRYLILIEGRKGENNNNMDGELVLEGFHVYSGDLHYTHLFAKIMDLTTHDIVATVDEYTSATEQAGIYFHWCFFPIPYYAPAMPTYSKACDQLGKNVVKVFSEMHKGGPED